jgi:protein ImuA
MVEARRNEVLAELKALVRAAEFTNRRADTLPALSFGLPAIDATLPTGGLMFGATHEVIGGGPDAAAGAAAAAFAGGILARTTGPVIWTFARRDLFAPGLASVGLHPDRVIYVEAGDSKTVLLVMEEALRHPGLGGVVGEINKPVGLTASRRLQLAAEESGGLGLVLRRHQRRATDAGMEPTAAHTRWQVSAIPAGAPLPWSPTTPGLGRARWRLDLLRCRGGEPKTFTVGACDASGRLGLPADLADRSDETERPGRATA